MINSWTGLWASIEDYDAKLGDFFKKETE